MPSAISRNIKHRRSRRINNEANQPQPASPIYVMGSSIAGAVLTLTFDQAVSLNGTPAFVGNGPGSPHPISALQMAPNVVAVTFNTTITGLSAITIAYRDPAIRNASGGFVTSNQVAVAA
jgi:hypothetical protein